MTKVVDDCTMNSSQRSQSRNMCQLPLTSASNDTELEHILSTWKWPLNSETNSETNLMSCTFVRRPHNAWQNNVLHLQPSQPNLACANQRKAKSLENERRRNSGKDTDNLKSKDVGDILKDCRLAN